MVRISSEPEIMVQGNAANRLMVDSASPQMPLELKVTEKSEHAMIPHRQICACFAVRVCVCCRCVWVCGMHACVCTYMCVLTCYSACLIRIMFAYVCKCMCMQLRRLNCLSCAQAQAGIGPFALEIPDSQAAPCLEDTTFTGSQT